MNDYEARRQARIKQNQALLAQLDIKPLGGAREKRAPPRRSADAPPATKRRRLTAPSESAPARTSARLAAGPPRSYAEEDNSSRAVSLPRGTGARRAKKASTASSAGTKAARQGGVDEASDADDAIDLNALVPTQDVAAIQAGWTAWTPVGPAPSRDRETGAFHFTGEPDFTPNKSPEEVLREGSFGGGYFRPLRSRKLGVVVEGDWTELPGSWIAGLAVPRYLTSSTYDADVNKFKVACGQSIEEWEAAGWISHAHDVRGWFQWYARFFQGRRCDDDARQIARWRKCVGSTGRWRRMLLKKYLAMGVREVWDDGEGDDEEGGAPQVSPVMHQTCHHWAFEVRQQHLDEAWADAGR